MRVMQNHLLVMVGGTNKLHTWRTLVGVAMFIIASIFFSCGFTSCQEMLNPRYSVSIAAHLLFVTFT